MEPARQYIRDLALKSTEVEYTFEGHRQNASAFFFHYQDQLYLVSNRHVLDEAEDLLNVQIRPSGDWYTTETREIQLKNNGDRIWSDSPEHPDADIAIVPLEFDIDDIGNSAYSQHDICDIFYQVSAGQSALVVGYPSWARDGETKFPIIRDCVISTPYGHFYDGSPCFLTDARSHSGLSGSPVVIPGTDVGSGGGHVHFEDTGPNGERIVGLDQTMILGIHSERIVQPQDEYESEGPLDLNRVWYIHLVPEVIDSHF